MRRYLPLGLLLAVLAHLSGCGESPNRPSVVTETPVSPPKTSARFIQVPWDISLFFNIPGGAVVAGATTAATSGDAAAGDNLTGTFVNSTGFAGTLTGVLTGNLEGGAFDGTLSTITPSGCTAERRFSGPVNTLGLNWSPGAQVNDCGGTSPLTSGIQAAAAPPTAPPPCSYTATATGTSVPAAGGTGTVSVAAGTGCNWFATSSAGFVTLSASQGTANGSVQFTVAANTGAQRTAIVVVAGQSFTITQAGVCSYRLNDSARTFDANSAIGGVDMRVAAGCAWQAQSDAEWLTITSGASGSGDGAINFALAANPGLAARVGHITAQGQVFTVTQNGISCQFTLTPSTFSFSEAGGNGSFTITTQDVCAWNAVPDATWITVSGTTSGSGNGTVTFSVARNGGAARNGNITVATGRSVTITQAQATTGTLTGRVTDVAGVPIADAAVSVGNLRTVTAANGTYTLGNIPLGSRSVIVSASQYISRTDTVTISFQTVHDVQLTPASPGLTFTFAPNPAFPDQTNLHCGMADTQWCWQSVSTIRDTGGATLTVTDFSITLYDVAGALIESFPLTSEFTRFYGAGSVPANGALASNLTIWFTTTAGGSVEISLTGVDTFKRTHRFVSTPRLSASPTPLGLQAVTPGERATTSPAPPPVGSPATPRRNQR